MKKRARPRAPKNNYLYFTLAGAALALIALLVWANWQAVKAPTVKAYFYRDEKLCAVERRLAPGQAPLQQALECLLAGPTAAEERAGLATMLPAGVKLRLVKADRSVAIIDLDRSIENYGGGSSKIEGIIAQIVYTATEVPGIDKAWIWVEGQREVVLGGEGLVLDRPLGRQDVKN